MLTRFTAILCSAVLLCLTVQAQETVTLTAPSVSRLERLERRVERLERERDLLKKQLDSQQAELLAFKAQLDALAKKLAALKIPVALEFVDTQGKPLQGITVTHLFGDRKVAQVEPDKNGQCAVEIAAK